MCLPWYDNVNRSTRESSHASSHGELDIHGTIRPSHGGGVWAAKCATLAASGPLWPCLSMSAPGVCLKGVSHSCRVGVGPAVVSCVHVRISPPDTCRTQTYLWTWRPCFPSTRHSVLGTGRLEPRAGKLPRRLVSACHVCPQPQKGRGACNVTVRVLKCNCLFQRGGCSDT